MTTQQRTAALFIALIAIGGLIYFFQSRKTSVLGNVDVVTVTPRVEQESDANCAPGSIDCKLPQNTPAPATTQSVTSAPFQAALLSQAQKAKKYQLAKEITTPDGFINNIDNLPVTIAQYVGKKVIVVDFWTYSCINCQRTTPYLNAWYDKYEDAGLVIIGVHTPEFDFEKEYANVQAAVEKFGIKFPVVLDNDFSTWFAYKNNYWPRKYIIDIDGYVVYDHIGEGGYAETEYKIQELLAERAAVLKEDVAIPTGLVDVTAKVITASSPETYFGAARNKTLANGVALKTGEQTFVAPESFMSSVLYLDGTWNITDEYATNEKAGAKIIFKYNATNVYFVADADTDIKIKVRRDGKEYKEVNIKGASLYPLITESQAGDHTMEIEVMSPHLKAFTFTFG